MSKTVLFPTIQLAYVHSLNVETVFKAIQFSIRTQFSYIQPRDRTISGATTPGQSGPGSSGNEEVLCIPQSSSITGTSPSNCLVSYQDTRYPSTEKQSVYSTATADWHLSGGK